MRAKPAPRRQILRTDFSHREPPGPAPSPTVVTTPHKRKDTSVAYHGKRIDELIAEGNGRTKVWDGMTLSLEGNLLPLRRTEVLANAAAHLGLPETDPRVPQKVEEHYVAVSPNHMVARVRLRSEKLVEFQRTSHPRRWAYPADARTRVVAQLSENPGWVASQFSAAALLGITDFSDGLDTSVLNRRGRKPAGSPLDPNQRRLHTFCQPWTLHLRERELKATPPMLTLAHCLRSVLAGDDVWQIGAELKQRARTLRAVQVVDRFRREFGLDEEHIAEGLRGLVNHRVLRRLLALSSPGMDSPPETLLRLAVTQAVADLGITFVAQVPVHTDGTLGEPGSEGVKGKLLTVIDLASLAAKVALFYDGEHHLERSQRDKDARILAWLTAQGWLVFRVSAGMLKKTKQLQADISGAIAVRLSNAA